MAEWLFKAIPTTVSFEETRDLATKDGFVCRWAYKTDKGSRTDNTRHVEFRDIIHVYFTGEGEPRAIGSFEVVGPNRHPHRSLLGRAAPGTVLFEVRDDDFAGRLKKLGPGEGEGYEPDPVLKKFTGWAVLQRTDVKTPEYTPEMFPTPGGKNAGPNWVNGHHRTGTLVPRPPVRPAKASRRVAPSPTSTL